MYVAEANKYINTMYQFEYILGVEGVQVRATLHDSRFDSGSERVTS